jgi:hypothetical protein
VATPGAAPSPAGKPLPASTDAWSGSSPAATTSRAATTPSLLAGGDRAPWLVAGGVVAACLVAYWLTRGTGPFWQDSGLFLAALESGGGLLSPGYPVYLLLGRPFVALFRAALPGTTFAEAGNFFSSACAALAAGLVALSIAPVLRRGNRFLGPTTARASGQPGSEGSTAGRNDGRLAAAAVGGLLAGLSYSPWFQALTAEAYALNALFAAGVLLLFVRLGDEGPIGPSPSPRQRRLLLLLLAVHGLSMGNHPVTVVFLPALAWLAWTGRAALRDRALVALAAATWLGAGLLPYLYLPWSARAHPANPFGDVTTLSGLLRHMVGPQWTGRSASYGLAPDRLAAFPLQAWHELFAAGLLGLVLGLAWLRRSQPRLLGLLALVAIPAAVLPLAYLRGGEYDFWLLPLWLVASLVAGLGLGWLFAGLLASRLPRVAAAALVVVVAATAIAWPLAVNAPLVSRRGDFVPEDFGRSLYHPLRHDAVLVVTSDQENALTYYLETVEGLRPDVARVDAGSVDTPWYAEYLRRRYPSLAVPASFGEPGLTPGRRVEALLLANFRERPVYVTGLPTFEPPAGAGWIPSGGLWRLSPDPEPARPGDWDFAYRNPRPFDRPARPHAPQRQPDGSDVREPYTAQVRRFQVQAWKNLGDFSLDAGAFPQASEAYRRALETDPGLDHPGILFGLGKALFLQDRSAEAQPFLERASGRLDPGRAAEASLYLGQILAAKGDRAGANERFAAVRALVPDAWPQIEASLRQKGLVP